MKNKKIIATLMALTMATSVAACNKDANGSKTSSETTTDVKTSEVVSESDSEKSETGEDTIADDLNSENEGTQKNEAQGNYDELPDSYKEIIDDVNDVIEMTGEDFNPDEHSRSGYFGIMENAAVLGEVAGDDICYATADIDGNGVDELIIAVKIPEDLEMSNKGPASRAGYTVLQIYTLDGTYAVLLKDCWSKNMTYITSDSRIISDVFTGEMDMTITEEVFDESGVSLKETYRFYSQAVDDEGNVDFFEVVNGGDVSLTQGCDWGTYNTIIENFTNDLLKLDLYSVNSAK